MPRFTMTIFYPSPDVKEMDMVWLSIILVGVGVIYLLLPETGEKKNSQKKSMNNITSLNDDILESGDIVREQLPALEEKALNALIEKGLSENDKTLALVALRNIGKVNYDPRVYKKTLLKLIDET